MDLNAKLNDPKYQKSHSSLQEQKGRIEQNFPLNDSKEREEEKIEFNSGILVFYGQNKQELEESIERRKQMGQHKEAVAKIKTDVANGPRRAVCANTLISMANFRSATLNNCVADYPEDMKKLQDDLGKKLRRKKDKYREKKYSPIFSDGDDMIWLRDEIKRLGHQIEAIEEAANIAIMDLDEKMINPKYQKSHSSLQEQKERIEKLFPLDASNDVSNGQKLEDSIIRRALINSPEDIKRFQGDLREEQKSIEVEYEKLNNLNGRPGNLGGMRRELNLNTMRGYLRKIGALRDRIQSIEEAANNAIVDLNAQLGDPKYSSSHSKLKERKEKIEQAFPLNDLNGKREEEEIIGPGPDRQKLNDSIKRRSEIGKSKN